VASQVYVVLQALALLRKSTRVVSTQATPEVAMVGTAIMAAAKTEAVNLFIINYNERSLYSDLIY
jgi:hypothetical protein